MIDSTSSPFADGTALPWRSLTSIAANPVLIVAPHPDDETLGCGGTMALLRALGVTVQVLVVSDGTQSHPNSRAYPAPKLKALRESETREALAILGVRQVHFVGLPDGKIPMQDALEARDAIAICQTFLTSLKPEIIFLPWRYDPHRDHRATWQLFQRAIVTLSPKPRVIEYPIWDWDAAQHQDLPNWEQFEVWRLGIDAVVEEKERAIAAYRSQTTRLINDDPDGFLLTPEILENFKRPWEVYIEEKPYIDPL
ncbi:MAG: PIG-L family deacetylase [Cyanobacteriota bacterium]|nr:PIG-L family deacetylase [Cyanobacteriota bacterium]